MYISDLSEDDIEIAIKVSKMLDSKTFQAKNISSKKTLGNSNQTKVAWL